MTSKELAEYKEKMLIAKEMNDKVNFEKYYTLFCRAYKKLTGKDYEEEYNLNKK